MSDKRGEMLVRVSLGRKIAIAVTSALAVVGAVVELSPLGGNRLHWIQMLPIVGLAIAGVCALLAPLAAQIVARAVQWSNLVLGLMLTAAATAYDDGLHTGLFLVLGCGTALLAMGRQGLVEGERRAHFLPVAFRSSLLLLMVFALADAQLFAQIGAWLYADGRMSGAFLLGAAALLFVGFVLLMRLSLFGLVLNVGTSAVVLMVALTAWNEPSFAFVVATLAGVHLLAAAPTVLSLARGKPVPSLGPRARTIGATLILTVLMAITVGMWLVRRGRPLT